MVFSKDVLVSEMEHDAVGSHQLISITIFETAIPGQLQEHGVHLKPQITAVE